MIRLKKQVLLVMLPLLFAGCSKNDSMADAGKGGYKDVVYAAEMEPSPSGAPYIVKGQYTDKQGNVVNVDEAIPWKVKLSNVSPGVKAKFEGYIFCTDTRKIVGSVYLLITEAGGDAVLYTTKKEYDLYKEPGYTNDELKEATKFSFLEK